uniref:UPF0565 protein C2orf69 homolog n=1 Tax=Cacopsylla melanoneura TaxID=428564 RepID=A0A8D8YKY9_9HEMI
MHFIARKQSIYLIGSILNHWKCIRGHISPSPALTLTVMTSFNSILSNLGLSVSHSSSHSSCSSLSSFSSSSFFFSSFSSSSSSSSSSTPSRDCSPVRLLSVVGDKGKTNDVVYCKAATEHSDVLVFFPGDVQDYPEEMSTEYSEYNLENTAIMLSNNFPERHILVVKPNRMELKTYACYDNFVASDKHGIPSLKLTRQVLDHLYELVQGVAHRIGVSSLSDF